jgi:hypothetical protein
VHPFASRGEGVGLRESAVAPDIAEIPIGGVCAAVVDGRGEAIGRIIWEKPKDKVAGGACRFGLELDGDFPRDAQLVEVWRLDVARVKELNATVSRSRSCVKQGSRD